MDDQDPLTTARAETQKSNPAAPESVTPTPAVISKEPTDDIDLAAAEAGISQVGDGPKKDLPPLPEPAVKNPPPIGKDLELNLTPSNSGPPADGQNALVKPTRTLDLTKDDVGTSSILPAEPVTAPYDPSEDQENARALIAYLLLIMLAVTIAVSFALLWAKPWHWEKEQALLQLVMGPLVALVGAATGYYFGAASVKATK